MSFSMYDFSYYSLKEKDAEQRKTSSRDFDITLAKFIVQGLLDLIEADVNTTLKRKTLSHEKVENIILGMAVYPQDEEYAEKIFKIRGLTADDARAALAKEEENRGMSKIALIYLQEYYPTLWV